MPSRVFLTGERSLFRELILLLGKRGDLHNNYWSHKSQICVFCEWRCEQQPFGRDARRETMIRKTRLFTPGPTPLLPAAQFAMAAADMHHRTPEFRALYQKVLAQLKIFVGTRNDVILLASSGTGAMEASV